MLKSLRRLQQATEVLTSHNKYSDQSMNQILLSKRYSQDKEVEFYATMVRRGLYDHEKIFFTQRLQDVSKETPILIVGGGCGREAIALSNWGYKVHVLDISSSMVQRGRKIAQTLGQDVQFTYSNLEDYYPTQQYGFIFVCTSILNFIIGQQNREKFLKKAHHLLLPQGQLALEVDVFHYRGLHRFSIASKLLKLKLGSQWESGDTIRSFYGNHNDDKQTLFYHFFQNSKEVLKEMEMAGFKINKCKDDFFWGQKL